VAALAAGAAAEGVAEGGVSTVSAFFSLQEDAASAVARATKRSTLLMIIGSLCCCV
jgi:hypothetical protein